MFDFTSFDISGFTESTLVPWGINLFTALAIFMIGRWVVRLVIRLLSGLLSKTQMDQMLIDFMLSILKAVLLVFVVIAALSQLGVDTTSLVALLGAAGLAIGLALQSSLSNFASGVMLLIFRPFKAGDFIEAAGEQGVVEAIGMFSTIMVSSDNKELIVPNGAIYGGTITNFSARDTRRIDMVFSINYDDDLKTAKQLLEQIVAEDERILPTPAPVVALSELSDFSVQFIVRPWVNAYDYSNVQWDTNEKVKMTFDKAGISVLTNLKS